MVTMKQSVTADKYNIAWFKLAEYVSRGEKERALGIYRLLSHSIEDQAFARQLEGDILWSFNDTGAAHKYHEAAQLYKKDQRVLQAAAIYEHLITLVPDSSVYLFHLVELYACLGVKAKVAAYGERLYIVLLKAHETAQLHSVLEILAQYNLDEVQHYERFIYYLLKKNDADPEMIESYIQKMINCCLATENSAALDRLIGLLSHHDQRYVEYAQGYAHQRKFRK